MPWSNRQRNSKVTTLIQKTKVIDDIPINQRAVIACTYTIGFSLLFLAIGLWAWWRRRAAFRANVQAQADYYASPCNYMGRNPSEDMA